MNFRHVWQSAVAVGDEMARSFRERQLPSTESLFAAIARSTDLPQPLQQAFEVAARLRMSAGTVPAEALVMQSLQALSEWMVAVRSGQLPAHSRATLYAGQLAQWLADQAQGDEARRRAGELVAQLARPAFEWLSRTIVEQQLTPSTQIEQPEVRGSEPDETGGA
jgi:hypothetical protein